MSTTDDRTKLLDIYLDDHAAGAAAGAQRAARLAESETEAASKDAPALEKFAADVAADRDALLAFVETMGTEPSRIKAALASAAEKLGALKLNGRLVERSPLSTIIELEALQMAVRGKRSLWETLRAAMPQPPVVELDALIRRADDQLDVLQGLHAERVAATFSVERFR
jgi:hypothetical protein